MPMAGIVEDAGLAAGPDARQHARQHRAQARPGHGGAGIDRRKHHPRPIHQRADAGRADIQVVAVELGRAGDA